MEVLGYLLVAVLLVLGIWFDRAACEGCGRSYSRSASRGKRRGLHLCRPCYRERPGSCFGAFALVAIALLLSWFVSEYMIGVPPLLEPRPDPELSCEGRQEPGAHRADPPRHARGASPDDRPPQVDRPPLDDPRDGAHSARSRATALTAPGREAAQSTPTPAPLFLDADDPRDVRR